MIAIFLCLAACGILAWLRDSRLAQQAGKVICFAIGSMDKRLTVWVNGCNRPCIVSKKQLFDKPILDMAWSADGKHIFAVTECGKLGHWLFMVRPAVI